MNDTVYRTAGTWHRCYLWVMSHVPDKNAITHTHTWHLPEEGQRHHRVGVTIASSNTHNIIILRIHHPHTNHIVLHDNNQQLALQYQNIFNQYIVEDKTQNTKPMQTKHSKLYCNSDGNWPNAPSRTYISTTEKKHIHSAIGRLMVKVKVVPYTKQVYR